MKKQNIFQNGRLELNEVDSKARGEDIPTAAHMCLLLCYDLQLVSNACSFLIHSNLTSFVQLCFLRWNSSGFLQTLRPCPLTLRISNLTLGGLRRRSLSWLGQIECVRSYTSLHTPCTRRIHHICGLTEHTPYHLWLSMVSLTL